ncbi:5,6-dimethylbenzimidazole synthase [Thauera sp. SWB20]|uniref:5,6-dimethylbenzimidazole synthase n=1 Tax=Thauera sp. SWB20 TaxID=1572758 RepID=UPI0005ADB0FA|nr:5,6-dimethylbenzimidazole synthase [Thauera sp. SWB20]KIN90188.1 5,6-dimethylbenzimidazole synthase [Thauera sp. SWB20]
MSSPTQAQCAPASTDASAPIHDPAAARFQANPLFDAAERAAVYRAIHTRRDVRGEFLPDPIPDEVLARVLTAAHHAPSVGFMQPWDFVVVRSREVRAKIHADFLAAHAEAEQMFDEGKRETYRNLKLEGILESPVNICITCDRSRHGPVVIGRTHIGAMDVYSAVCAVQNLWLAARAENLGVGWVSILHQQALREALGIPREIVPIAYLCVGYVRDFHAQPELEAAGWLKRVPLPELLHFDGWQRGPDAVGEGLIEAIGQLRPSPRSAA